MNERLPGLHVPHAMVEALEAAGEDSHRVGLDLTVEVVRSVGKIDGVGGVHLLGMGHDDSVRAVVERAGLFPRPTGAL